MCMPIVADGIHSRGAGALISNFGRCRSELERENAGLRNELANENAGLRSELAHENTGLRSKLVHKSGGLWN